MKFVPTVVLALWITTAFPSCVFATASPTKKPWSILGGATMEAGSNTKGSMPGCAFAPHNLHGTTGVTTAGAAAGTSGGAAGGIRPTPSAGMRLPSVRGLWKALCTAILPQDFKFAKKVLFVALVGGGIIKLLVDDSINKTIDYVDQTVERRIRQVAEGVKGTTKEERNKHINGMTRAASGGFVQGTVEGLLLAPFRASWNLCLWVSTSLASMLRSSTPVNSSSINNTIDTDSTNDTNNTGNTTNELTI